jgi:hypothetical protein
MPVIFDPYASNTFISVQSLPYRIPDACMLLPQAWIQPNAAMVPAGEILRNGLGEFAY